MAKVDVPHSSSSSLWSNCQPDIQRRINALLNCQAEYFRLRIEFHRQIQELQYVYNPQFENIIERQRNIIDGSYKSEELEKYICESNQSSIVHNNQTIDNECNMPRKGLENFWLKILKNVDSYDYPIQRRDQLCLKYLSDIRCILDQPDHESSSFTLEFHFSSANPFFIEKILTKKYVIRYESNHQNPYESYDGPEVDRCYGCLITWKPNHNLMIKNIRLENIEEPIRSFFEFFSPPIIPENGIHEMTNEDQIRLESDIEFGLLLKQRVLPRAVLFYTGEALSLFDNDEDDDDEVTSSDHSQ